MRTIKDNHYYIITGKLYERNGQLTFIVTEDNINDTVEVAYDFRQGLHPYYETIDGKIKLQKIQKVYIDTGKVIEMQMFIDNKNNINLRRKRQC